MSYYIYHNWRAHGITYKIHEGNCGFCQNGNGMREDAVRGWNGVWIGPFDELEYARQYLITININPDECMHDCIQ